MQVIPVLDLLDGHVVRAVRGERDAYRPIQSHLAAVNEPVLIARALLDASDACHLTLILPRILYIADLGAILQRGAHVALLARLRAALPGVEIWLDAGYADYASMRTLFDEIDASAAKDTDTGISSRATLVPVFGTESLRDPDALHQAAADGLSPILSLDHRAGQLLALTPAAFDTARWSTRVIAMTLDHVGSYAGPDLSTFERIRASVPAGTTVIGAGGIRHRADLDAVARTGAEAWLVASALHDGWLAATQCHLPLTP